jgi:two-component system cell cycle response regulator
MAGRGPILIVDDNATNLKLARVTLEMGGFEVVVAADAEQARAAIRARRPALVLMDIQLPGTDGLALTRELKRDPLTAGITIVALSAYAMKGDAEKARRAGCDGYISKPIDTRTLGTVVEEFLSASGDRARVLVVEDNPSFGKLLRLGLEREGFDAELVPGIEEARAALAERRPDAIVLDGWLSSPGDGLAFCRDLKRGRRTKEIPIVMLSGSDGGAAGTGEADGPDLSLMKTPEDLASLPGSIRKLLAPRGA